MISTEKYTVMHALEDLMDEKVGLVATWIEERDHSATFDEVRAEFISGLQGLRKIVQDKDYSPIAKDQRVALERLDNLAKIAQGDWSNQQTLANLNKEYKSYKQPKQI